jgi:hypothetical protein
MKFILSGILLTVSVLLFAQKAEVSWTNHGYGPSEVITYVGVDPNTGNKMFLVQNENTFSLEKLDSMGKQVFNKKIILLRGPDVLADNFLGIDQIFPAGNQLAVFFRCYDRKKSSFHIYGQLMSLNAEMIPGLVTVMELTGSAAKNASKGIIPGDPKGYAGSSLFNQSPDGQLLSACISVYDRKDDPLGHSVIIKIYDLHLKEVRSGEFKTKRDLGSASILLEQTSLTNNGDLFFIGEKINVQKYVYGTDFEASDILASGLWLYRSSVNKAKEIELDDTTDRLVELHSGFDGSGDLIVGGFYIELNTDWYSKPYKGYFYARIKGSTFLPVNVKKDSIPSGSERISYRSYQQAKKTKAIFDTKGGLTLFSYAEYYLASDCETDDLFIVNISGQGTVNYYQTITMRQSQSPTTIDYWGFYPSYLGLDGYVGIFFADNRANLSKTSEQTNSSLTSDNPRNAVSVLVVLDKKGKAKKNTLPLPLICPLKTISLSNREFIVLGDAGNTLKLGKVNFQ